MVKKVKKTKEEVVAIAKLLTPVGVLEERPKYKRWTEAEIIATIYYKYGTKEYEDFITNYKP
jgi:hypothetical protein